MRFYQEAARQSAIDPATVVAIARSETGDDAARRGLFTLGIDVRGAGGSGGSSATIGNATHTFYAYATGEQAARGLADFLRQNPRYGGDVGSLFNAPAALLRRLVDAGYSGCPGPECDAVWDSKILSIRNTVLASATPGMPQPGQPAGPAPAPIPSPGTPTIIGPGGLVDPTAPSAIKSGIASLTESLGGLPDTLGAVANAVAALPNSFITTVKGLAATLAWLGQENIWKRLGLVSAGFVLVVVGLVLFALSLRDTQTLIRAVT